MSKTCRLCGEIKELTEFYKHADAHDRHRGECKECTKANSRARHRGEETKKKRREHRAVHRVRINAQKNDSYYRSTYGITVAERDALLATQGGECAVCHTPIEFVGKGGGHLDHDHATGKIRGVLCMSCNTGLGQFKDSTERLLEAALYLEKHRD